MIEERTGTSAAAAAPVIGVCCGCNTELGPVDNPPTIQNVICAPCARLQWLLLEAKRELGWIVRDSQKELARRLEFLEPRPDRGDTTLQLAVPCEACGAAVTVTVREPNDWDAESRAACLQGQLAALVPENCPRCKSSLAPYSRLVDGEEPPDGDGQ